MINYKLKIMFGFLLLVVIHSNVVYADCTSNPVSNIPTGNFTSLAWTFSGTGDACSNLSTANYTGDVFVNLANAANLTMNASIKITGNFNLTNQGSSTMTIPNGVVVEITGDLGDAANNNVTYNVEAGGQLIVGGTIYGKNGNAFTGTGTITAGTLAFSKAPSCVDPDCPSISAASCEPASSSFCTTTVTPLPIELIRFNLSQSKEGVIITWTTATEENNDYFTVERSTNGIDFEVVTNVVGNGNSTKAISYYYVDESPFYGRSYYRLKQTDFDGKSETFSPKSIYRSNVENLIIQPNPVVRGGKLTVYTGAEDGEVVELSIFSASGTKLLSCDIESISEVEIGTGLEPGLYIVKVQSGNNQHVKRLLIK